MTIEIETSKLGIEIDKLDEAQNPIPGGETLMRSELGSWALTDTDGEIIGYGIDPVGALCAKYSLGQSKVIYEAWTNFQDTQMEGGEQYE